VNSSEATPQTKGPKGDQGTKGLLKNVTCSQIISGFKDSRWATLVVVVAGLALTGGVLERVAAPAWLARRAGEPALQFESIPALAGPGLALAVLGGFRTLAADIVWLRMHLRWERRDLPGTDALLRVATALDPRPLHFWLNGARIMAYDLAAWRLADAGDATPPAERRRMEREQAGKALAYLATGSGFHPAAPELWVERANIELNRLGDLAAAAQSYRRAWELPRGPYHAARLHAVLLRRLGRPAEALAWLVQLHPALPPQDDAAAADVVISRIRELEKELGVAADRRYRPAANPGGGLGR